jgi:hypothetical protein
MSHCTPRGDGAQASRTQGVVRLANEAKEFHFTLEGGHNNLSEHQFAEVGLIWLQQLVAKHSP